MIVIGGRSNGNEQLPFEIYDTETSDWYKFNPINRFRHCTWLIQNSIYLHGGFDPDIPNIPTELMLKIDLSKIFHNYPSLL